MKLKKPVDSTPKEQKRELFTKGYGEIQSKVSKRNKFIMSCYNCEYFYQAMGDTEEMCQNSEVLRYDMIITENNICCAKWKPCLRSQSVKSIFKKGSNRHNGK